MKYRTLRLLALCLLLTASAGCATSKHIVQAPLSEKAVVAQKTQKQIAEPAEIKNKNTPVALIMPTKGTLNSQFGMRKHPTKRKRSFHYGIDIGAKRGTLVVAAADGTVIFAGRKGRGYGNTIEIRHNNGIVTRYAHLDKIQTRKGEQLAAGERIGTVGRTGRTSGANLHLEVLLNNKAVNPLSFIQSKNAFASNGK